MIMESNAAVIASSAAMMSLSRRGGGFHGTELQFVVLFALIGVLAGGLLGTIFALCDFEGWKDFVFKVIAMTIASTLFTTILAAGIIGIKYIVDMI